MSFPVWLTLPNALTLLRIVLTPFFGYLWWRHHYGLALAAFAVAGVSDFFDGLLARVLDQHSKLGQLLDPAADKLLVLVSVVTTAATGAVPWWLAALVIGRDVLLAAGGAFFSVFFPGLHGPERWRPTRMGKYATFFTVCTIGLALLHRVSEWDALRPFVGALGVMCAATATLSGLQYLAFGVRALVRGAKLADGGNV